MHYTFIGELQKDMPQNGIQAIAILHPIMIFLLSRVY